MLELVALIPALPLAGFVALLAVGARLPRRAAAVIGVGSVGAAMVVALAVGASFFSAPPPDHAFTQKLWTWMNVGGLAPAIAFTLDPLSLVMVLVVTVVGFLIHLYSAEFMADDEGFSRFFAYMNLFVASMLVLVLADNLLLLYMGWEGVGLCSYLLIGFWYKDPVNARAAVKAFVVTRVGDAALAVGLLLLFVSLGTLDIQAVAHRAAAQWEPGSGVAVAAAALLLAGAVGKSAQLPLQTWLPDAMAGPTPTSALIHAATMVTAGVYLIARTHVLFTLAPPVQLAVAVLGAVTLLVAGTSALAQQDIKRVLAYSTISQVGYMFLALGVGAWGAAIFHFMTHAFFKSLLFLGAGVVIMALHHEHNMMKMGGLRKSLPGTFWAFLVGGASLAALPLVTAGFYSKDLILAEAWASSPAGPWLWAAGLAGALVTAIYTFRMIFLVFFGPMREAPSRRPGVAIGIPLAVLAALSVVGGLVQAPAWLGGQPLLTDFLAPVLPQGPEVRGGPLSETALQLISAATVLAGLLIAYLAFMPGRAWMQRLAAGGAGAAVHRFLLGGWGFDWLYDTLIVRPFLWAARANKADFIDIFYALLAWLSRFLARGLVRTQNGQVQWYALGLVAGAVVIVAIVILVKS
jgi:NADH-quinone oxidoreductase subunit L